MVKVWHSCKCAWSRPSSKTWVSVQEEGTRGSSPRDLWELWRSSKLQMLRLERLCRLQQLAGCFISRSLMGEKSKKKATVKKKTHDIWATVYQKAHGRLWSQLEVGAMVGENNFELFGHQTEHDVMLHIMVNIASPEAWWWQQHAAENIFILKLSLLHKLVVNRLFQPDESPVHEEVSVCYHLHNCHPRNCGQVSFTKMLPKSEKKKNFTLLSFLSLAVKSQQTKS